MFPQQGRGECRDPLLFICHVVSGIIIRQNYHHVYGEQSYIFQKGDDLYGTQFIDYWRNDNRDGFGWRLH